MFGSYPGAAYGGGYGGGYAGLAGYGGYPGFGGGYGGSSSYGAYPGYGGYGGNYGSSSNSYGSSGDPYGGDLRAGSSIIEAQGRLAVQLEQAKLTRERATRSPERSSAPSSSTSRNT
jgi:hypothetical protein